MAIMACTNQWQSPIPHPPRSVNLQARAAADEIRKDVGDRYLYRSLGMWLASAPKEGPGGRWWQPIQGAERKDTRPRPFNLRFQSYSKTARVNSTPSPFTTIPEVLVATLHCPPSHGSYIPIAHLPHRRVPSQVISAPTAHNVLKTRNQVPSNNRTEIQGPERVGAGCLWCSMVRLITPPRSGLGKHIRPPCCVLNVTVSDLVLPYSAATNIETGQEVAIKKVQKVFEKSILAKRALREIKLLKHFNGHENVRLSSCQKTE